MQLLLLPIHGRHQIRFWASKVPICLSHLAAPNPNCVAFAILWSLYIVRASRDPTLNLARIHQQCLLFVANDVTVPSWCQLHDRNTELGPTGVDSVPQGPKNPTGAFNLSKWKKKFLDSRGVSTNPTVAELSRLAGGGLTRRCRLTFVLSIFHVTTPSGRLWLKGCDLKRCVVLSYSPFYLMPAHYR